MKNLKLTRTDKLSESEWQTLRQSFVNRGMIGGSDAGTLLGFNKYKSPINLFYQSVGLSNLPNKMNSAMLHGKQLESYVADCWQYWDGTEEGWVENTLTNNKIKKFQKVKAIIENPKYPSLFSNIDGKITKHPNYKKPGILEIKTISGYSSDSYEAGLPPSYLLQVQQYMLVTGYTYSEICYLKDGRQLGCVTFDADKELQERILEASVRFQQMVFKARTEMLKYPNLSNDEMYQIASSFEPDADSSQAFNDFISDRHKARENEVTIQGGDEWQDWANQYVRYSDLLKRVEERKRLYQNKIKQVMENNNASVIELPKGKITWRKQFNVKL